MKRSVFRSRWILVVSSLMTIVALIAAWTPAALAVHSEASLSPSNFEIDSDANLKLDDAAPSVDWASLGHPAGPEQRATDKPTGQTDDSYQGGVKEDTSCPGETTGSIPNNKSDLLTFHVYKEAGSGAHPGFLNLAWSRVSDPNGTTLMDFEFNQSSQTCANSPNKVRSVDDLLIEYAIDQGGSRAAITGRKWTGTAWGPSQTLSDPSPICGGAACAVGTINSTAISAAESDGLIASGSKAARTFGEAQIDLRLIFQANKCTSFGSAMLKSRSSDAFTSQLKDFIQPLGINLTNCGKVIIRKVTEPAGLAGSFGFTKSFATDPTTTNTFALGHGESKTFNNVLFGSGYSVSEDEPPAGFTLKSIDCSASTGVTPSITLGSRSVSFAIDADTDVLDCTFTNEAKGTIIVRKVINDGAGTFGFTSSTLPSTSFSLTPSGVGAANAASQTFANLTLGTYDVAETLPAGWKLVSSSCSDGSAPSAIGLGAGETVTCTFVNERKKGAIRITKTRKHAAAANPAADPHANVSFTVAGGSLASGVTVVTNAQGVACVDGLVLSSFVGNYTVTEQVPSGYVVDAPGAVRTVAVTTEATCGGTPYSGQSVSFSNTPKTNITVSVDSQVPGGTKTVITCQSAAPATIGSANIAATAPANGDGSLTVNDLLPGIYTCTIDIDP